MARLGLRPAGDNGTYLQSIALTQRRVDTDKTSLAVGKRALVYGDDFLPGQVPGTVEGAVVYVGNGTVIRSRGVDPYKDLDVTGKIVVSNTGLPAGLTPADLKGPSGDDWEGTEQAARRRGAVAVLFLPDYGALERWPATRESLRTRTALSVDAFAKSAMPGHCRPRHSARAASARSSPAGRSPRRRRSSARCDANRPIPSPSRQKSSFALPSPRPTTTRPPTTWSPSSRGATPSSSTSTSPSGLTTITSAPRPGQTRRAMPSTTAPTMTGRGR